jgi:hypothetical protein
MKVTPSGKSPETDSEKLFAAYLDTHKYDGWLFEPNIDGCSQHPDFVIPFDEQSLLFEVKERRRKGGEPTFASINPMAGIREEIGEARRKFKELKSFSCSLVVYNAGDIDTLLKPEFVFGAMLGEPGFSLDFDPVRGVLRPDTAQNVFLPRGGKMIRSYSTGEMWNTTINAVIILEHSTLTNVDFDRTVDDAIVAETQLRGRMLTERERATIAVRTWLQHRPDYRKVPRVCVCENPGARNPLTPALFQEEYDERWAIVGRKLQQTFCGSRVAELVDHGAQARRPGHGRQLTAGPASSS